MLSEFPMPNDKMTKSPEKIIQQQHSIDVNSQRKTHETDHKFSDRVENVHFGFALLFCVAFTSY